MNPLVAVVSAAALSLVAAAGVVAGYRRRDPAPIEPVPDPLDERRAALLRSLADLEDARAAGGIDDDAYVRLRRDTQGRMARLLRAIDGRDAGSPADPQVRVRPTGRVPGWAVALLLAATVGSVLVAALLRESEPSSVASTPATGSQDPFAFFERRVRQHPSDLAARLDLAHRYLDAGRIEEALAEYSVALELDPADAEALTHVGQILYISDRPAEALESVDRALEDAPEYPEALFTRGVILLEAMDRPVLAIEAFERYLEAAPFGSERAAARSLIEDARAAIAER